MDRRVARGLPAQGHCAIVKDLSAIEAVAARAVFSRRFARTSQRPLAPLLHSDDDFPEVLSARKILVCLPNLAELKDPVDDRAQSRRD
jgi:hypothetical protein